MRHELKYILQPSDYIPLKKKCNLFLKKDSNAGENGYYITSLYFDNEYNSALCEKIQGENIRHKYRIRFYNDDTSNLKLERKSKINFMTLKDSCPISKEEVQDIISGEFSFLKSSPERLKLDLYKEMRFNLLRPKTIVRYRRDALVHPVGNTRVTFDSEVSSSINGIDIFNPDILYVPTMETSECILEIKFNGVYPSILKDIIQTSSTLQTSASKYVFSRKFNFDL